MKKKILLINDEYIEDDYKGIKYYWKDIEEGESDKYNLKLKLYDPIEYMNKYDSPVKRFQVNLYYKLLKKIPPYKIDLAIVSTSQTLESVLEIINNYSITSQS